MVQTSVYKHACSELKGQVNQFLKLLDTITMQLYELFLHKMFDDTWIFKLIVFRILWHWEKL